MGPLSLAGEETQSILSFRIRISLVLSIYRFSCKRGHCRSARALRSQNTRTHRIAREAEPNCETPHWGSAFSTQRLSVPRVARRSSRCAAPHPTSGEVLNSHAKRPSRNNQRTSRPEHVNPASVVSSAASSASRPTQKGLHASLRFRRSRSTSRDLILAYWHDLRIQRTFSACWGRERSAAARSICTASSASRKPSRCRRTTTWATRVRYASCVG